VPKIIIDYGGGPGYSAVLLGTHFPNSTIYFWEPFKYQRDFCKALLKATGVNNVVIVTEPLTGEVMNCIGVLEHVKQPEPLLDFVMSAQVEILSLVVGGALKWAGHFSEYTLENGDILKHHDMWKWCIEEARLRRLFPTVEKVYHFNRVPRLFARRGFLGA
jgi:hypothetical protein